MIRWDLIPSNQTWLAGHCYIQFNTPNLHPINYCTYIYTNIDTRNKQIHHDTSTISPSSIFHFPSNLVPNECISSSSQFICHILGVNPQCMFDTTSENLEHACWNLCLSLFLNLWCFDFAETARGFKKPTNIHKPTNHVVYLVVDKLWKADIVTPEDRWKGRGKLELLMHAWSVYTPSGYD